MPSKTYNSPTHHLRRLSWPTLINPNVLICKSRTTEFKDDDDQPMTNGREVRLIKLNGRQSNNTFRAANSTLVDNLFRSIRKRKLKHPINCFNRKNVKLQLLFSCPTTSAQDYLHIVNLNRSMRSRTPTLSQSAINLTELDNGLAFKRLPNQRRLRCATRSSVDEFELLSKWPCLSIFKNQSFFLILNSNIPKSSSVISNEILLIRLVLQWSIRQWAEWLQCEAFDSYPTIVGWLIRL